MKGESGAQGAGGGGEGGRGAEKEGGWEPDRGGSRGRPPFVWGQWGEEGGAGRSRARGRSLAPRSPRSGSLGPGTPLFRRVPGTPRSFPRASPRLPPGNPGQPSVQAPTPASQAGAAARDSDPSGDLPRRKRQLLGPGPPYLRHRSSPRFCLPGASLCYRGGACRARGRGGHREQGWGKTTVSELLHPPRRTVSPLFRLARPPGSVN